MYTDAVWTDSAGLKREGVYKIGQKFREGFEGEGMVWIWLKYILFIYEILKQ